jgi:hypothetical protein
MHDERGKKLAEPHAATADFIAAEVCSSSSSSSSD